jgi:hypothetical protein
VSETEEELISDEEDKGKPKKKIFSLGYLSKLVNKKIYSDDFDVSFDTQKMKYKNRFNKGSVYECPISEDVESEDQNNNYLSDNSSCSSFSFKKKKMSFDLSRLIDKSEPSIDDSSLIASKYYGNVNETIEEEEDDKEDNQ